MDGKGGAEELISKVLNDPALLQSLTAAAKPEEQRLIPPRSSENEHG